MRDMYTIEELLPVVTRLTEQYTGMESTSVSYETAKQLIEAILYCIREKQTVSAKQEELCPQQKVSAMIIYQAGYEAVINKTKQANQLYGDLLAEFCSYGNRCLAETVQKGMPKFFLRYDAKFCPQDTLLTLDYPTLTPDLEQSGIDRIDQYLRSIQKEQKILSRFSETKIYEILTKYHNDYEEQIFNLCEVVIKHQMLHQLNIQSAAGGTAIQSWNKEQCAELFLQQLEQYEKEESEYLKPIAAECLEELTAAIEGKYLSSYLEHYL